MPDTIRFFTFSVSLGNFRYAVLALLFFKAVSTYMHTIHRGIFTKKMLSHLTSGTLSRPNLEPWINIPCFDTLKSPHFILFK